MNKTFLTFTAFMLGTTGVSLPARAADGGMAGMDMGDAKAAAKPSAAPLSVSATLNPAAPRTGDNTLDLTITRPDGKPATGLKLTASVAMTSMDMGTTHPAFAEKGNGHYVATVSLAMDGPWRMVVRNGSSKVAVLDFNAGSKTPWKSPQIKKSGIKAAPVTPNAPTALAATAPVVDKSGGMAGMDMGGSAAGPSEAAAAKPAAPAEADKPTGTAGMNSSMNSGMPGMDMGGTGGAGMDTGTAGMKTATIPQLKETGTYTATGDEDWKQQTGFGHNAPMVGMMNQMMVGGSGMEGMKMAPMKMKFDEQNYAKPEGGEADSSMPGMDMGGKKDAMSGMKMEAAPAAAKPDAPPSDAKTMPGMNMGAPATGGGTAPPVTSPMKITAAIASAPKAGDNPLTITLTDAQGKPVAGANVTTSVAMTSMDMGTTHPAVTEKSAGQYSATVTFGMAGPWRVRVKVSAPGQKPQTKSFDFTAK